MRTTGRHGRKGQTWSADIAISTVLFIAAILIAYRLTTNLLDENGYDDVNRQAIDAARVLGSDGYPATWSTDDVIRAGIVSDGHLSLRKANELAELDYQDLKRSLRATDEIHIYAFNTTHTVPVFGTCGLGGVSVTETAKNRTLPAIAITRGTPAIASAVNATIHADDSAYGNLTAADVLIIEGNLTTGTTMTADRTRLDIEDFSRRGGTIVVIGDPGVGVLGIEPTWSDATTIEVEPTATAEGIGLAPSDSIAVAATPTPIATITEPSGIGIADVEVIARTDIGEIAMATWIRHGSRVWYLATAGGSNATLPAIDDAIAQGVERMITVPWPDCGNLTVPASSTQVAYQDRAVADHDRIITLRTVVWRPR